MVYSIDGTKIANLKVIKTIDGDEKFPVSKIKQAKPASEQSYACKYDDFYAGVIDRDIRKSDFVISSNWYFSQGLSVIPHETNPRPRVSVDVATLSYFYNKIYKDHFCALSAKMYGDNANGFEARRKPSYLGMVVISHSISEANKNVLNAVYGADTVWEKIGGRFLLTTGANVSNTDKKYGNNTKPGDFNFASAKRTGGTKEVLLTTKNIASHTHTLCENGKALPVGKLPYKEKPLEPDLTGGGEYGICSTPGAASSPDWGKGFGDIGALATQVGGIESLHHEQMAATRAGGRHFGPSSHFGHSKKMNTPGTWATSPISPSDIWGGGIQTKELWGTFQAKFDVGDMTASCNDKKTFQNVPHNNVPPLIVEYIWERVL